MNTILRDLSPQAVILAHNESLTAFWSQLFGCFPQAAFYNDMGTLWFETGIRHDIFNRGLQTYVQLTSSRGEVERATNHFRQHHLPFLWHLGEATDSISGRPFLERHGLTHYETEPVMAIDLLKFKEDMPAVPQLSIRSVTTTEALQQWIHVWELGNTEEVMDLWFTCYSHLYYRREGPLHLYIGILDGEAVATAEVFFGGGVAYIGAINTLARYRGRGIGTSMTSNVLQSAQKQGYHIGVLTASPMGETIYRRLGFQEYGTFSTYLWHPQ